MTPSLIRATAPWRSKVMNGALREDSRPKRMVDLSLVSCTCNRVAKLAQTLKRVLAPIRHGIIQGVYQRAALSQDGAFDPRFGAGEFIAGCTEAMARICRCAGMVPTIPRRSSTTTMGERR
jgi:hypothetical protein